MNSDGRVSGNITSSNEADRRSLRVLLLAGIIGIGLGSLTAADWLGGDNLPHTVVARVNDADIQRVEYDRALRLFASEKRDPLGDHDRALLLRRMVEEELLVQHGVASGLVRSNRGVRTTVIQSIVAGLLVEVEADAGTIEPAPARAIADTRESNHDTELREYLEQLRAVATLRWMDGSSGL